MNTPTLSLSLVLLSLAAPGSHCASLATNWAQTNPNITTNANSLQQTVSGVTVTVRGYVAEFAAGSSFVFGPFRTGLGDGNYQVFGNQTAGLSAQTGLGLHAQPIDGLAVTGLPRGGGAYAPGIDNFDYLADNPSIVGPPRPRLEFLVFSFSAPVNIDTIQLGNTSNFSNALWAAAGQGSPDFSNGLASGLSGFNLVNVTEAILFTKAVNLTNLTTLIVGAPAPNSVGPFAGIATGSSAFYLAGFTGSTTDTASSNIPEPSTWLSLGLGLVLVCRWNRRSITVLTNLALPALLFLGPVRPTSAAPVLYSGAGYGVYGVQDSVLGSSSSSISSSTIPFQFAGFSGSFQASSSGTVSFGVMRAQSELTIVNAPPVRIPTPIGSPGTGAYAAFEDTFTVVGVIPSIYQIAFTYAIDGTFSSTDGGA